MGKWTQQQHAKYKATMERKRREQRSATTKQTSKHHTPVPTIPKHIQTLVDARDVLHRMTLPEVSMIRANATMREVVGQLYRWCSEIIAAD